MLFLEDLLLGGEGALPEGESVLDGGRPGGGEGIRGERPAVTAREGADLLHWEKIIDEDIDDGGGGGGGGGGVGTLDLVRISLEGIFLCIRIRVSVGDIGKYSISGFTSVDKYFFFSFFSVFFFWLPSLRFFQRLSCNLQPMTSSWYVAIYQRGDYCGERFVEIVFIYLFFFYSVSSFPMVLIIDIEKIVEKRKLEVCRL